MRCNAIVDLYKTEKNETTIMARDSRVGSIFGIFIIRTNTYFSLHHNNENGNKSKWKEGALAST